jgi:hypothetical protein
MEHAPVVVGATVVYKRVSDLGSAWFGAGQRVKSTRLDHNVRLIATLLLRSSLCSSLYSSRTIEL